MFSFIVQDIDVAYNWFRQAFSDFLLIINSLEHARVPSALSVSIFSDFSLIYIEQRVTEHLSQILRTKLDVGGQLLQMNSSMTADRLPKLCLISMCRVY
jgi:hypothetical protein